MWEWRARDGVPKLQLRREVVPDGVQRGLVSSILQIREQRLQVGWYLCQPTESLLRNHYDDLQEKPFFPSLLSHMLSGPVLAHRLEGKDVVASRAILGATNPCCNSPQVPSEVTLPLTWVETFAVSGL
ncbi:hypothetical protein JCM33374_g6676 [Metschnikowia sp. JCM 33374]|nr:hypothetical protein JCM33374_g6676 [Metschnikowia sp. JCM 33374]